MTVARQKIEFGDFQTPIELAEIIVNKLIELNVKPDLIIEPTCGVGNFLLAASKGFLSAKKIVGIELNSIYLEQIKNNASINRDSRIIVKQGNFFDFSLSSLISNFNETPLILGNFPWVTNSKQGLLAGSNLPLKSNFQNHKGLNALTGKSNFDISEWMLIKTIEQLQNNSSYLAMICKTSVARKILNHINKQKLNLSYCATYGINAKQYFNANVESCLLFCKFELNKKQYFCDVFSSLNDSKYQRIGYYNKTLVRDFELFNKVSYLFTKENSIKWRSGIKHDCSKVMELSKIDNILVNGFGETVEIENNFVYPLLKGSDIANNRINQTRKYVIVTQRTVGEATDKIKKTAPKTWKYLVKYREYLDKRKSKVYQNKPQFSIFGVGNYSFNKYKIAVCGLYKNIDFKLIEEIEDKPVFFDDTVYFLSFNNRKEAINYLEILNSKKVHYFYDSLIFWDEKRPIKASILNKLDINKVKF